MTEKSLDLMDELVRKFKIVEMDKIVLTFNLIKNVRYCESATES